MKTAAALPWALLVSGAPRDLLEKLEARVESEGPVDGPAPIDIILVRHAADSLPKDSMGRRFADRLLAKLAAGSTAMKASQLGATASSLRASSLVSVQSASVGMPATLGPLATIEVQEGPVSDLVLLGDQLVTCGDGHTRKTWSSDAAGTDWKMAKESPFAEATRVLVVSGDDVVTGGSDAWFRILRPNGGSFRAKHAAPISAMCMMSTGCIAVGLEDGSIHIHFSVTGNKLYELPAAKGAVTSLAEVQKGVVAIASGVSVELRSNVGALLSEIPITAEVRLSALNGRSFALSHGEVLEIWGEDGKLAHKLEGHTADITTVVHLGDDRVATGSADHSIRIWNYKTKQLLEQFDNACEVTSLLFDGGRLAAGGADGTVRWWRVTQGERE